MTASEKLRALDKDAQYWPLISALPLIADVVEAAERVAFMSVTKADGSVDTTAAYTVRVPLAALDDALEER